MVVVEFMWAWGGVVVRGAVAKGFRVVWCPVVWCPVVWSGGDQKR